VQEKINYELFNGHVLAACSFHSFNRSSYLITLAFVSFTSFSTALKSGSFTHSAMPARTSFTGTPVFLPHRLFVKNKKLQKVHPAKQAYSGSFIPTQIAPFPQSPPLPFPTWFSGIVYFSCELFTPEIVPQQKSFIE